MTQTITDKASERRANLVAAFAHDIKAPLAGNAQLLELMLDDEFGALSNESKEIAEVMLRSNRSTQQVLQLLVEIFCLEAPAQPMPIETVDLAACLKRSVDSCDEALRDHVHVEVADGVLVRAEPESLRRLLSILFTYSLKLKAAETQLFVRSHSHNGQTEITISGARLTVGADTLIGDAFKDLCNSDSGRKLPAGAGMALYLSALIVEANHGILTATNVGPEGTTFSITLPCAQ